MTVYTQTNQDKWKPGVPKHWLLLLAGLMWIGVGCMLDCLAGYWLKTATLGKTMLLGSLGLACALAIHRFGFLRIVDKNLARILPMEGKRCVFSFMPWKSYIMIMVMIAMGATLRHSALPKPYLAVLYLAIGTALMLSSIRYFRCLIPPRKTCNRD